MNSILIDAQGVEPPPETESLLRFAHTVLETLEKSNWEISILFTDDILIQNLNKQYRNKDEPTDVLSFEQGTYYELPDGTTQFLAGDIAISLPAVARNAENWNVPYAEELHRLLLHGILHLAGYDHTTNDASEPMLIKQEALMQSLYMHQERK
ncbi:MAG TPA: rRNA maturation RNase YbeY [Spirochaetia bacterium]|nr:rRNA maturation RNase YbeY [Spirochaetales bacterium]HRS64532.1 rRNA maturation RNase YbeY [Spirochaetia bacterium]HOT59320.1 rRNA maturation RNase YbeY [Spirochaetales bacterium]HPD79996.1 rRNA maturation RNase YbeY [Spirochaetales bacterium]HQK34880.1 rRNA maturation RNase YbeY [Spirochaetales bacterium]